MVKSDMIGEKGIDLKVVFYLKGTLLAHKATQQADYV